MSAHIDIVVIGAGVVGLATAAALARAGRSVLIVEKNSGIAQEISSRNSEVIHSGIYYPEDSLKAKLCVAGRDALYARCTERGISHRRLGKLIVATETAEIATLEELQRRGTANGAPGLELLSARDVSRLEPEVRAEAALISPSSGIIDGQALSLSYLAEAESFGAMLALRTEVLEVESRAEGYRLRARGPGGDTHEIHCAVLVNAAGLGGDVLAERAGFDLDDCGYRLRYCKGNYFALAAGVRLGLSHLIYPVPAQAGLGIHVTLDLSGRIRFGPDAEYVDAISYEVDIEKLPLFARAIKRYLPSLDAECLAPDFAGVRPKLSGPGEDFRDFVIREESQAGFPGFVNLIGIESPGLTAAPAIADHVVELLASL
jgi:L-2-hydroxyglutarate oxidase LhgO